MNTGRTLWTRALAAEAGASACDGQPVSVSIIDETVLAGSTGHVFALGLDDGAVLWHTAHRARGSGETSLAIGTPGGDYVARLESQVSVVGSPAADADTLKSAPIDADSAAVEPRSVIGSAARRSSRRSNTGL